MRNAGLIFVLGSWRLWVRRLPVRGVRCRDVVEPAANLLAVTLSVARSPNGARGTLILTIILHTHASDATRPP